jgi:hypothetical protein
MFPAKTKNTEAEQCYADRFGNCVYMGLLENRIPVNLNMSTRYRGGNLAGIN